MLEHLHFYTVWLWAKFKIVSNWFENGLEIKEKNDNQKKKENKFPLCFLARTPNPFLSHLAQLEASARPNSMAQAAPQRRATPSLSFFSLTAGSRFSLSLTLRARTSATPSPFPLSSSRGRAGLELRPCFPSRFLRDLPWESSFAPISPRRPPPHPFSPSKRCWRSPSRLRSRFKSRRRALHKRRRGNRNSQPF
jgi:hypothetical protein